MLSRDETSTQFLVLFLNLVVNIFQFTGLMAKLAIYYRKSNHVEMIFIVAPAIIGILFGIMFGYFLSPLILVPWVQAGILCSEIILNKYQYDRF